MKKSILLQFCVRTSGDFVLLWSPPFAISDEENFHKVGASVDGYACENYFNLGTSDLKQSSMGNGSKKHYICQAPLHIKMFWKSKIDPEFFCNNIWRGIPRWFIKWCLSFVPWNTFLNMVQETTSTQLWLVIVKLPSFYECHEHSALSSPFGRNEHLKCLSSYIFTHSDKTL